MKHRGVYVIAETKKDWPLPTPHAALYIKYKGVRFFGTQEWLRKKDLNVYPCKVAGDYKWEPTDEEIEQADKNFKDYRTWTEEELNKMFGMGEKDAHDKGRENI